MFYWFLLRQPYPSAVYPETGKGKLLPLYPCGSGGREVKDESSSLKYFSPLSGWSLDKVETVGLWAAISSEWERLSPDMCSNLAILGTKKSTKVEPDGRPLAWISWPWEASGKFSLRPLLRSSTSASSKKPIWSIDQTSFANELVLIWWHLEMTVIL